MPEEGIIGGRPCPTCKRDYGTHTNDEVIACARALLHAVN